MAVDDPLVLGPHALLRRSAWRGVGRRRDHPGLSPAGDRAAGIGRGRHPGRLRGICRFVPGKHRCWLLPLSIQTEPDSYWQASQSEKPAWAGFKAHTRAPASSEALGTAFNCPVRVVDFSAWVAPIVLR